MYKDLRATWIQLASATKLEVERVIDHRITQTEAARKQGINK